MADLTAYQVHVTSEGDLKAVHTVIGCAEESFGIPGRRQFVSVSNILKAVNEHQHTEHPHTAAPAFDDGDDSVIPFVVGNSGGRTISSHQEAINDTGEAYTAFHGWLLGCLWCPHKTTGKTKAEALAAMTEHYDVVAPHHGPIR